MPFPIRIALRRYHRWFVCLLLVFSLGGCPQPAPSSNNGGSSTGTSGSSGVTGGSGTGGVTNSPGCTLPNNADALQAAVLTLVNQERSSRGLSELTENGKLQVQAEDYACTLIVDDFFAHEHPDTGQDVGDRADNSGYSWQVIGENLAAGQQTAQDVMDAWMDSPGHRANILDARFTEIGIGVQQGGDFGIYWVQVFGKPR